MFLIDLLFPKFCLGCGYIGVYLCPSCLKKLSPIIQDVCLYCKKPSLYGLTHPNCISKLNIDGLISIYSYNPILKKIIKNFKYRLATEVWKDFCKIITPEVIEKLGLYKKLSSNLVIQPIPLSKTKYGERGFNQALFISMFFQKFLRFPIVDLLVRKKEVLPQAQSKDMRTRHINISNAFNINPDSKDSVNKFSNLLLIDDVVTSGSTVKEAAKILKKAGVKKIYVLTLARG